MKTISEDELEKVSGGSFTDNLTTEPNANSSKDNPDGYQTGKRNKYVNPHLRAA